MGDQDRQQGFEQKAENAQQESEKKEEVLKTVPSTLENKFADFTYRFVHLVPNTVHPNVVTAIGILAGLFGGLCFFLGSFSKWFFLPAALGLLTHIVCDNFDGYMARTRNQCTKRGAFFDLVSDTLVSTFTVLCIGLSKYAHMEIVGFGAPLYGLYMMVVLHYIILYNEFPFPHMGPFEIHCFYMVVALVNAIFGQVTVFHIGSFPIYLIDLLLFPGIVEAAAEIAGLGFKLFFRLKRDGM